MSDYSKLPPLAVSLGGFAFNGEHIEYWKAQATKADREIASLRAQLASAKKAAIEECARIAEGTAQVARGNFFAARRDQCAKIAAKIRALTDD